VSGPVRSTIDSLPLPSQQNRLGICENQWKLVSGTAAGLAVRLTARASLYSVLVIQCLAELLGLIQVLLGSILLEIMYQRTVAQ